ncbi:MAG: DUF2934 domain-containing protein [Opitutaceae bacterium]|nr:DUF2934 domain-containing protein [Opitutaceae bacterium]
MKHASHAAPSEPSEQDIQDAAYQLWIEAGRPDGRDLEHWHVARERLRHHHGHDTRDVRRRQRDNDTGS